MTRLDVSHILTDEELLFLKEHQLNVSDFFDGRGLSRKEQHDEAKRFNRPYIIGANCKARNHRLRTRNGHCVQCDPSRIKYIKRFTDSGAIYIAKCNSLYKVGLVENNKNNLQFSIKNRKGSLNGEGGYAGSKGWDMVQVFRIDKQVGRIEHEIHRKLAPYSSSSIYIHSGQEQLAKETFECSYDNILSAITKVFKKYNVKISPVQML